MPCMKIFSIPCTVFEDKDEPAKNAEYKTIVLDTFNMIRQENLDIRTITMGISLLDCGASELDKNRLCNNVYDKIARARRSTW